MKFIIRDDDINYHFTAEQLEKWYDGITESCPISVSVPAFVKGDFFKWVNIFENHIPYNQNEWLNDNKVYKLGDNVALTQYLKRLLREKKIAISMHGVFHRNDEMEMGEVQKNFIRGAEYYTNRDYADILKEAKEYLNELFGIDICSFSPPQNMINEKGLEALVANKLSLCTDFISPKKVRECIKMYGLCNCLKLLYYRLLKKPYPYVFHHHGIGFVRHCRLQPGKDIEKIKEEFEYTYRKNGVFVLSTHSYGFDTKMSNYDMTMKEALIDILRYSQQYNNIEYTTLHDLFKDK